MAPDPDARLSLPRSLPEALRLSTDVEQVVDRERFGEALTLVTDAERLWKSCVDVLRDAVPEVAWRTCLEDLVPLEAAGGTLVLSAPNSLVKARVEERWLQLVADAATGAAGEDTRIELVVAPGAAPGDDDEDDDDEFELARTAALSRLTPRERAAGGNGQAEFAANLVRQTTSDLRLNPRYTFDEFVIGQSNRFAHAAALSVAEKPAKSWNPLFIHGESGLGKTHLLHAIGHYVHEHFPGSHVRYVSTETFMNDFIDAIRTNSQLAFKRRYRQCDVLLVDDIQFLENKEGTQEEFFHTFNSLHEADRQIVITSDRPPRSIATLEDRLQSRFMSGLTTDVQPPDIETRLAILHQKAHAEGTVVPDEVLEFIATHIRNNIRELEGALNRVSAFGSLSHEAVSLDLAERVLSDLLSSDEPRPVTPAVILETTARTFGFTIDELRGPSRRRPLVTARQICMYVFRELTDLSYPSIAKEFGGRDHTTAIHAVEKIKGLMHERRAIFDQVTELIHRIKTGG